MSKSTKTWVIAAAIVVLGLGIMAYFTVDGTGGTQSIEDQIAAAPECTFENPNARVTFTEFSDFQCPACKQRYELLITPLKEAFGDNLVIEYKHFPLDNAHPYARIAAAAAEAAKVEGKFWEMHDLLFENQQDWTYLNPDQIGATMVSYGEEIGINSEKFLALIQDPAISARVQADYEEGLELGVNSTPTFFFKGVEVPIVEYTGPYNVICDELKQQ